MFINSISPQPLPSFIYTLPPRCDVAIPEGDEEAPLAVELTGPASSGTIVHMPGTAVETLENGGLESLPQDDLLAAKRALDSDGYVSLDMMPPPAGEEETVRLLGFDSVSCV